MSNNTINILVIIFLVILVAIEETRIVLLKNQAWKDKSTGLLNKNAFEYQFEKHWSSHKDFTLAVVDLDGLKTINDVFGHTAGDRAIKLIGTLLKAEFPTTFRFGGDEFTIITNDKTAVVKAKLEKVFAIAKSKNLSFSFGLSEAKEHDSKARLFTIADSLMYAQKQTHHERRN